MILSPLATEDLAFPRPVSMVVPDDVAVPPPLPEREISAAEMQLADSQMQGPVWEVRLLAGGGRGGGSAGGSARDVQVVIPSSVMHRIFSFVHDNNLSACAQVSHGWHRIATVAVDAGQRLALGDFLRRIVPSLGEGGRQRVMDARRDLLAGEILPRIPRQRERLQIARQVAVNTLENLDLPTLMSLRIFECPVATHVVAAANICARILKARDLGPEESSASTAVLALVAIKRMVEPYGSRVSANAMASVALGIAARFVTHPSDRDSVRLGVVQSLLAGGNRDRVREIVDEISQEPQHTKAHKEMVKAFLAAGQVDSALAMVAPHPDRAVEPAICDVVTFFLEQNQMDRALELARSIRHVQYRSRVFGNIAKVLVNEKKVDEALALVDTIPNGLYHQLTLCEVAETLSEVQEEERALQRINSIERAWLRDDSLCNIVKGLAKVGRKERALAIAGTISSPYVRSKAFREIAATLAEAQKIDEALEVLGGGPYRWATQAFERIVKALVRADQVERAFGLVDEAAREGEYREVAFLIVKALVAEGEIDKALVATDRIPEGRRTRAYCEIVKGLVAAKKFTEAREMTSRIPEPWRVEVEQVMYSAFVLNGEIFAGLEGIDAIPDEPERVRVFLLIIAGLVEIS